MIRNIAAWRLPSPTTLGHWQFSGQAVFHGARLFSLD